MEGIEYLVALNHFTHFGPRRLKFLFTYFGSWQRAWEASVSDLINCGIKEKNVSLFIEHKNKTEPSFLFEKIKQQNIKLLTIEDKLYPPLLKEIYAPPPLLYYKGEIDADLWKIPLAIVGTRKSTNYGQMVCEKIINDLIKSNFTIISGLAIGIDALAHQACLNNNGRTVAFLGCGVDQVYPKTNQQLAAKITKSGAIISEFPPNTAAFKTNFPQRNRLIAGASLGTLIIEASAKSGALITARYALDENREVMAVPGPIYNQSCQGTNNLIKQGARAVTEASDIINCLNCGLNSSFKNNHEKILITEEEKQILQLLSNGQQHINELIKQTKLDTNVINSRLTIMEIKGLVKNLGNMEYTKTTS